MYLCVQQHDDVEVPPLRNTRERHILGMIKEEKHAAHHLGREGNESVCLLRMRAQKLRERNYRAPGHKVNYVYWRNTKTPQKGFNENVFVSYHLMIICPIAIIYARYAVQLRLSGSKL